MKVYVGNLPFSVDSEGFKKLFSDYDVEELPLLKTNFQVDPKDSVS